MSDDICSKENEWGSIQEKCKRYDAHIDEGERPGGHRDRLAKLEIKMDIAMAIANKVFLFSLIGGIIGGLLGKITPSFFEGIVKLFVR